MDHDIRDVISEHPVQPRPPAALSYRGDYNLWVLAPGPPSAMAECAVAHATHRLQRSGAGGRKGVTAVKSAQGPSSSAAECAVAHAILCTQPTELVVPLHKSPPSSSNGQGLSNRFSKTVYCELWITISSMRGTDPLAARTQPPQECPVCAQPSQAYAREGCTLKVPLKGSPRS